MKSTSLKIKLKNIDALLDKKINSYQNNKKFLSDIISSKTIHSLKDQLNTIKNQLSNNKKVFQKVSNKCVQLLYLCYKSLSPFVFNPKIYLLCSAALELIKIIYVNNSSPNGNMVRLVYIKYLSYLNYLVDKINTPLQKGYFEKFAQENINEK